MIIYKATNIITQKSYIGQTVNDLWMRRGSHKYQSLTKNPKTYFHRSIRKYGWNMFTWEILCECDTQEELDEMEFHYIKQYKSLSKENGYNIKDGGYGGGKYIFTAEHRDNISKAHKGKPNPNVAGEKNGMFGKHHTAEIRAQISTKLIEISDRGPSDSCSKEYLITDPQGNIFTIKGMKHFCDNNNLTPKGMRLVMQGFQTHHKGYKCELLIS